MLTRLRKTLTRRPTKLDTIAELLAYQRSRFGDARMEGADDDGGNGGTGDDDNSGAGDDSSGDGDRGFPANTPVAEMSAEQQAAYWRNETKKQQRLAKSRSDYDQQKAKAQQYDELVKASQTEQERAVEAAKKQARDDALREAAPQLVTAKFEALAVGRTVNGQPIDVDALTEDLDLTRYLTDDGKVDVDKVRKKLDAIAPKADGNSNGSGGRRYDTGGGNRGGSGTKKGDAGKAEADRRFATSK